MKDLDCDELLHKLHETSKKQFARAHLSRRSSLKVDASLWLNDLVDTGLCQVFAEQLSKEPSAFKQAALIDKLIDVMVSEELDKQLISYFQSEYAIASCSAHTISDSDVTHWNYHLTPRQQLTLRLYIQSDGSVAHHGNLLDANSTAKIRETVILNDELEETFEIWCQNNSIDLDKSILPPISVGSGLLYNPTELALKDSDHAKHAFIEICFVPSPYHYKYVKQSVAPVEFHKDGLMNVVLKLTDDCENKTQTTDAFTSFPPTSQITSLQQLRVLLNSIFPNNDFAWHMFTQFIALDPDLKELNNLGELVNTLKLSFQNSIGWSQASRLGTGNIKNLMQLAEFEQRFDNSTTRYAKKGKPDPNAIFWPNPNPKKEDNREPLSRFKQLPFVKRYPIVNKDTPIGSAGSCFAQEIAKVFQEEGYNYIIEERNDDPAAGMVVDNYKIGDKHAIACANYGILFNTPSFRQLAERAFATKPTQKILFQREDGLWLDPFRENVGFYSQQAYKNDYQNHLDATRRALEKCEVFIVTLGLNECWELYDGTVLSRNPQKQIYALVKHKTLSVQENVDNIQAFFDTVKKYNPNFKLIITVSPIPFLATGHGEEQHVITANTHSKSVLRVAAHELVANNTDMYYLPSYELVTQCIKDPWQEDDRHVTVDTVKQVVHLFKEIFVDELS
ncbi:hypothetical protein PA25_05790 [Pseudoalteromonas sp. A25]|uniref:GSCFA domain-containing protein n=1 Tax=Pseudoalteromonas sp. A25 TaxID=116092 RepID=UPI001260CEB1|nr:GSCFA domain-containing protein [Pseudoalteromonas sp. A25]BBN80594.1 hypothetical protein PA25_05790 [Pseudoalteromonas sp. A25]